MQIIYIDLELDFMQNRTLKTVYAKQHDNGGRALSITLYNNGEQILLDDNSDTAWLNASVNGTVTVYERSCTISNSNAVIVPINEALTTLAGTEHCEIKIKSANGRTIYTATFDLDIEESPANTDSPATLKTTELASALSNHESRLDSLENGSGAVSDLAARITSVENEVDNVEADLEQTKSDLSASISTAKSDILNRLGTPANQTVSNDIAAVSSKIDTAKTTVTTSIGTSETRLSNKLTSVETELSEKIDDTETLLSTDISSAETAVRNKIDSVKSELLTEIENVREEFQDKHDETLYELQKVKNEIVRKITAFADELAAGNGSVAGRAVLAARGAVSTSYTSAYTEGDE